MEGDRNAPWIAGAFVWTGFDYKGEPTPHGWPNISSAFGIIDTAGFPKDTFWYYRAWWSSEPVVHILPHWNWPVDTGNVKVWVHSNADSVELFLNGVSLGSRDMPHLGHLEWDFPYSPGTLEARGTKQSRMVATDRVETTGEPAAIRLKTDQRRILSDGQDVALVQVEVVDEKGRVVHDELNRPTHSPY